MTSANGTPTSKICVHVIFVLLVLRNEYVMRWGALQWHDIRTEI